jgi:hypothetical protein
MTMSLAEAKAAFRKIAERRLAALGSPPQLKTKVESQLKDLDRVQTAAVAWGTAMAILQGLAAGVAATDLGCCTYFIDGEPFKLKTTQDECATIPSNPPGSFNPDPTNCP